MARCTADTLDAADDVCDGCGQPFCEAHLIRARGAKKKPLCSECAVVKAGLRRKEVRTSVASRSEVRKNRKAVKKSDKVSMEHAFEYFDEQSAGGSSSGSRRSSGDDDVDIAMFDKDPDKPKRGRRKKKADKESAEAAAPVEEVSTLPAPQASAADLWEQIRADTPKIEEPKPSLSPPPPSASDATADDDPWAQPGPFEPEPVKGMPSTFEAPRQQMSAPPPPSTAATPPVPAPPAPVPTRAPAPAPPRPSADATLAAPAATPTSWTQPAPESLNDDGTGDPPPPTGADEPPAPTPTPSWAPAPVNEIDFGFDKVDAVDSLGRPLFGSRPTPAPEPEATREIPPAFAERPSHAVPASLRPAEQDDEEPASDLPDALRPR